MAATELEKKIGSLNEMNLQTLTKFIDFLLFSQQQSADGQQAETKNGFLSLAGKIGLDEEAVNNLRKESMI